MVVAEIFAPGNAGIVFYRVIAIPVIGFALLWLQHRLVGEPDRASGALPSGGAVVNR